MGRPVNSKCQACALHLSTAQAREVYGTHGDDCWVESRCKRRRSHYQNYEHNIAKRRSQAASAKISSPVERLEVEVNPPPVAFLYLYKPPQKDAHLHALSIKVWQGSEELVHVEPIHTMGFTNAQVKRYLREVLNKLKLKYPIDTYEPPIILPPTKCPLDPCPLKLNTIQLSKSSGSV